MVMTIMHTSITTIMILALASTVQPLPVVKHATSLVVDEGEKPKKKKKNPCPISFTQDGKPIPSSAGDDCNNAIPERDEDIKQAITKGKMLGDVYNDAKDPFAKALKWANEVTEGVVKMLAEAKEKLAKDEKKVADATKDDKKKNPMTGKSKFEQWEEDVIQDKAEIRVLKQIQDNAKITLADSSEGNDAADELYNKISSTDYDDLQKHKLKQDELASKAAKVFKEADTLWTQLDKVAGDFDCGMPPPVQHNETACTDGNTKTATKCDIVCMKGYTEEGSMNNLRCEKQGKFGEEVYGAWFGQALCLPMNCGPPDVIEHTIQDKPEVKFPNSADYQCVEGFTMTGFGDGSKHFSIDCTDTGNFAPTLPEYKCQIVECGTPPEIDHAAKPTGTYFYKDPYTYSCNEGATLDATPGGLTGFEVSCQATGFFTDRLDCQPIICGPSPVYDTAGPMDPKDKNATKVYADEVKYNCSDGHSLNGQYGGSVEFTMKCKGDAEFHPVGQVNQPECAPVTCGMAPVVSHGTLVQGEMFFPQSRTVTAATGYTTTGRPQDGVTFMFTCGAEGRFLGVETFVRIECGDVPVVGHATVINPLSPAKYTDVIRYDCERGYSTDMRKDAASASFSVTCLDTGLFTDVPNLGSCMDIDECFYHTCGPFGTCVDEVEYEAYHCDCEDGYEQKTDEATGEKLCGNIDDCGPSQCGIGTCEDLLNDYKCHCPTGYEETTTPEEKVCMKVVCGLPDLKNAVTLPVEAANLKLVYEDQIKLSCNTGYALNPDIIEDTMVSLACGKDKSFYKVPEPTTTTTTTTTIPFPALKRYKLNLPIAALSGWTVYYDAPYADHTPDGVLLPDGECILWGTKTSYASSTLSLAAIGTGSKLRQLYPRGNKQSVTDNGMYWYSVPGKSNGFNIDSNVRLNSADVENANCEARLSWHLGQNVGGYRSGCTKSLNGNPTWRKIIMYGPCGAGAAAASLLESNTSHQVGSNTSHKKAQLAVRTKMSHIRGQPEGTSCEPVNCGDVPPVMHATADKESIVFAENVKYTCDEGHSVDGTANGPKDFSVVCEATARYSDAQECKRIFCGTPEETPNAVRSAIPLYYMDTVTYSCFEGYTLDASVDGKTTFTRECKKDGTFTEMKSCQPIECGDMADLVEHATAVPDGVLKFSEEADIQCDAGYTKDGKPPGGSPIAASLIGYKVNFAISNLGAAWKVWYDQPYSHHTNLGDIFPPQGDCILWGAKSSAGSSSFALAGVGKREKLLQLKQSPYEVMENNIYWYSKDGRSNGFAASSDVALWTADVENSVCEPRLSWHLGDNVGGYRVGCQKSLNGDSTWRKVVMYGPCSAAHVGDGMTDFKTKCQKDGGLSAEAKCVPVSCGEPPDLDHASRSDETKTFGQTVTYNCDDGFSISGDEGGDKEFEAECLADGSFSYPDEDLQCQNIDDCPGHTCGPHGSCFDLVNDYTCNCTHGFEIREEGGEKICGNIDDCDGHSCGMGTCVDHIGGYSCECPAGYGQEIIDGEKTCNPLTCAASPPSLTNGELKTNHNGPVQYLTTLRYECNNGYTTDGTAPRAKAQFKVKCLVMGVLEAMSACYPVNCGTAPWQAHADLLSPGGWDHVKFGTNARYRCHTGYKIGGSGNGAKEFTRGCQDNGLFTSAPGSCQPVRCGSPPSQNWAIPNMIGNVNYGENLRYLCWLGFTINQKAFGPVWYGKTCQENGQFSSNHGFFLQEPDRAHDSRHMEQDNVSFVQTNSVHEHAGVLDSPEVDAAMDDDDKWESDGLVESLDDSDEDEADYDDEDDEVLLQEEGAQERTTGQAGSKTSWGRRRRDRRRRTRRRRTRRRRCSTMTSTTTGYYGCHPVFVPIPCIHNVVQNVLNFLNPFHPAGFNIFAWIQLAQNKTRATAKRIIRASHSTKEDPEPPEVGDSVFFGCEEGESINGNANGARGFTLQLLENGHWDPEPPEPGCSMITYRIQGEVIDAFNGLKISGVKVSLFVAGEEKSVTTNEAGTYDFENIPGGNWTLSATKSGKKSCHKNIIVASDVEPDTTATLYMARTPTEKEWVAVLSYDWPGVGILDTYTKWGPQSVFFGNKFSVYGGTSAAMIQGGLDEFNTKWFELEKKRTEATLISFESGCDFPGAENCDVKIMVNDAASAGNIEAAHAKVVLLKGMGGNDIVKELKIEDCGGSVESGWWHVATINAKTNSMKWNCHDGGEGAFLQKTSSPHFNKAIPHHADIDFESYVGPFPGRFWRHSRRHARKNHTGTSSSLKMRGADSSPNKLRVGAADVDVKSTA